MSDAPLRPVLPSAALTPARVPGPDASWDVLWAFSQLGEGYEAAFESGEAGRLLHLWDGGAHADFSLDELRVALLFAQRSHYWSGGSGADMHERQMQALTDEIRARVAAVPAVPLSVWTGGITRLAVDAVVNAANERMLGGGGVDGAIHRAAGPDLLAACRAVPEVRPDVRCPTGEARATAGYALPARFVIHTVGPVWHGGRDGEDAALASAYTASLAQAFALGLDTVAFPALSTGVYGFPADRAARVAVGAVRSWQAEHVRPSRVLLVAFSEASAGLLRAAMAASAV